MGKIISELDPEYVDIKEVPTRKTGSKWARFFDSIPDDKAALLTYDTRQRVHQIRTTLRSTKRYLKRDDIHTRVIHGTMQIHGHDKWILYVWRDGNENK